MMIASSKHRQTASALAIATALGFPAAAIADNHGTMALKDRVSQLEQELARTKAQLAAAQASEAEAKNALAASSAPAASNDIAFGLFGGTLKVGGAMRANYAVGDYGDDTGGPSRAWDDGGNFTLDTFRVNLDYANDNGVGLTAADQLTFFREGDVVYQVFAAGMLPGDAEC